MGRLLRNFLIGLVLVLAIQTSFAAIENVSRGKNTTQSSTYRNGTSDKAVDGNYNNMDLDQCATLLSPRTTRSSSASVSWKVDLGDLYAIVSITIYNTAVLPEATFVHGMQVCARHRNEYTTVEQCMTVSQHMSSNYRLLPGGDVTIHFNQLVVADQITIRKSGFLTLCEVDVLGTEVFLDEEEEASVGKATSQSRTLEDRLARYAVDGNTNGTDLSTCATSLSDLSSTQYQWAWWQVNLGDFYLVKAITVYFPTVRPDSLYTYRFHSFISFNNSLPSSYAYSGAGKCYDYFTVVTSSGVSTLNCTLSQRYMLIVGRYVTVMPYSVSTWGAVLTWRTVLTVCEVTVVGVRQDISADDPALAVFSPPTETETGPDLAYMYVLSIAAIVIAGVFAILCIILIIVIVVKLKGKTVNAEPPENPYHDAGAVQRKQKKEKKEKKPKKQKQHELQTQVPADYDIYSDTIEHNDDEYEYVDPDVYPPGRRMQPQAPNMRY